jgi:hypothetical protein
MMNGEERNQTHPMVQTLHVIDLDHCDVEEELSAGSSSDDQNNNMTEYLRRRGQGKDQRRRGRGPRKLWHSTNTSTCSNSNIHRNFSIQSLTSIVNIGVDLEKGYQEDTLQEQSNRLTRFLLSKTELATFDLQVPDDPKEITVVSH